MRTTQQFSITLTNEMADMVRARVASGAYASESEVIREGLRALNERDKAIEAWLTHSAAPSLDSIRENPNNGRSISQVRAAIRSEVICMTYEVIITPEAEQQIINLHRYITEKAGNVIADNYANALLDYLDGFSTFPHRGNKRDDIRQGDAGNSFPPQNDYCFCR